MARFISDVSGNHLEVSLEIEEGTNVIVFRNRKKRGRSQAQEIRVTPGEFGHIAAWLFEILGEKGISCRPIVEPLLQIFIEKLDLQIT